MGCFYAILLITAIFIAIDCIINFLFISLSQVNVVVGIESI